MRHFSYKDIKKATDGFQWIIHSNSHGTAYKAKFQDGVALVKEVSVFNQGNDVFYREVQLLGRLHHRHLLPLKGFCTGHKRFGALHVLLNLNKMSHVLIGKGITWLHILLATLGLG